MLAKHWKKESGQKIVLSKSYTSFFADSRILKPYIATGL